MRVERRKLGQRSDDSKWPEKNKDELGLKAGRIQESEEMNVCGLECAYISHCWRGDVSI